jgi:hypothetical protein
LQATTTCGKRAASTKRCAGVASREVLLRRAHALLLSIRDTPLVSPSDVLSDEDPIQIVLRFEGDAVDYDPPTAAEWFDSNSEFSLCVPPFGPYKGAFGGERMDLISLMEYEHAHEHARKFSNTLYETDTGRFTELCAAREPMLGGAAWRAHRRKDYEGDPEQHERLEAMFGQRVDLTEENRQNVCASRRLQGALHFLGDIQLYDYEQQPLSTHALLVARALRITYAADVVAASNDDSNGDAAVVVHGDGGGGVGSMIGIEDDGNASPVRFFSVRDTVAIDRHCGGGQFSQIFFRLDFDAVARRDGDGGGGGGECYSLRHLYTRGWPEM